MLVLYVEKSSDLSQILPHILEFTVEKNHMDVLFVVKDLPEKIILPHIQESTVEKNHMNVQFVVRNSWQYESYFTLESSH